AVGTAQGVGTITNPNPTATHLKFLQQPTGAAAGQTLSPAVTVAVEDASNNVLMADQTDVVTLAVGSGPGGSTLSGTLTAAVVNGIATFANLSLTKAGT